MGERHNWRELLSALIHGTCSDSDVRAALAVVADNPLARVYAFHGDLLRALMEVPNAFWARHPALYNEYREVVRAGALARRDLPTETKEEFWSPLELED